MQSVTHQHLAHTRVQISNFEDLIISHVISTFMTCITITRKRQSISNYGDGDFKERNPVSVTRRLKRDTSFLKNIIRSSSQAFSFDNLKFREVLYHEIPSTRYSCSDPWSEYARKNESWCGHLYRASINRAVRLHLHILRDSFKSQPIHVEQNCDGYWATGSFLLNSRRIEALDIDVLLREVKFRMPK